MKRITARPCHQPKTNRPTSNIVCTLLLLLDSKRSNTQANRPIVCRCPNRVHYGSCHSSTCQSNIISELKFIAIKDREYITIWAPKLNTKRHQVSGCGANKNLCQSFKKYSKKVSSTAKKEILSQPDTLHYWNWWILASL